MSVLVKGMKMPKCCKDCALFHADSAGFYGCFATMEVIIFDEGELKPDWCPLVAIPEHGVIVDVNLIRQILKNIEEER